MWEDNHLSRRSLSGAFSSGLRSLAKGQALYALEYLTPTPLRAVGYKQAIVVERAELGRASTCQVRFDASFTTVSRRHAAIVKDGDKGWKLEPLSQTNATVLNDSAIDRQCSLSDGDVIQLSANGPKLRFCLQPSPQEKVFSLKERLHLFGSQAVMPFKKHVAFIMSLSLLVLAFLSGMLISRCEKSDAELLAAVKKDVFFIVTKVYLKDLRTGSVKEIEEAVTSGTGFLLKDRRFVTARHCVQPWLFTDDDKVREAVIKAVNQPERYRITSSTCAYSDNLDIPAMVFSDDEFEINDEYDVIAEINVQGRKYLYPFPFPVEGYDCDPRMLSNDVAYATYGYDRVINSSLEADFAGSTALRTGETLHILGFPQNLGVYDGSNRNIEPIHYSMTVARDSIDYSGCILATAGADHGNSGGPVLVRRGNRLAVAGIVSRQDENSLYYNHFVPISEINSY